MIDLDASQIADLEELGRQLPLARREELISRLAQPGAGHVVRPLCRSGFARREPEQLLLVRGLVRIGTEEAAFALGRLAQESASDQVRWQAASDATTTFTGGPDAELFSILRVPQADQQRAWRSRSLPEQEAIAEQLESVLAALDRDQSSKAAPYNRLLRQALVRLPLVAQVGGPLEDLAAQRFRQISSNVGDDEAVALTLMRPERARDYVIAALSGQESDRAGMALGHVLRIESDHELGELARGWLRHDDDAVASAAISAILHARPPATGGEVREMLERIERAAPGSRAAMVDALLDSAERLPGLSLAWLDDEELRELFIARARDDARRREALESFVLADLEAATEPDEVTHGAAWLEAIHGDHGDLGPQGRAVLHGAHAALGRNRRRHQAFAGALGRVAGSDRMRPALWRAFPSLPADDAGTRLMADGLRRVALAEGRSVLPDRLRRLLEGVEDDRLVDAVIGVIHEGLAPPRVMAGMIPDEAVPVVLARSRAVAETDQRAIDAEEEVESARRDEDRSRFLAEVQPLVERATREAEGNSRLVHHYSRLTEAFARAERLAGSPPPAAARAPRGPEGAADLGAYLRLDKAAVTTTEEDGRRTMAAALAASGVAQSALTELFEGGPSQRLMARLSRGGRDELLDAARDAGFETPAAWIEHPALGAWLARRRLEGGAQSLVDEGADERSLLLATLEDGTRVRRRLDARKREQAQRRVSEQAAIARTVAPALEELDLLVLGHARVRNALEGMGWEPIAVLGEVKTADSVDPVAFRIIGDAGDRYVVRGTGVRIGGQVVIPATLERMDDSGVEG